MSSAQGWIGVDLDGTLAFWPPLDGQQIGEAIPAMLQRVNGWIAQGVEVRIFTARACDHDQVVAIAEWLSEHDLPALAITNIKDYAMLELWDDRAVHVQRNVGEPCCTDTASVRMQQAGFARILKSTAVGWTR